MREKRMERVKEVSRMIRSSGIKSEHSLSHTRTHTREGMRLHNTHVSPESGSRWQYSRQPSPSTHRR